MLANHLRENAGFRNPSSGEQAAIGSNGVLPSATSDCQRALNGDEHEHARPTLESTLSPNKRRRVASPVAQIDVHSTREGQLPSRLVLDQVISKYFATIHHWIPMLHERRFRARLADKDDWKNLVVLLHALVAVTLKHVDTDELGLSQQDFDRQIKSSTDIVTLCTMEDLSVENGQALVMLCFERLGSGKILVVIMPKAYCLGMCYLRLRVLYYAYVGLRKQEQCTPPL